MDNTIATPLGPDDPHEIGEFTIIGLLGRGGMGEVYLGITEGGYVAVKRILPHLISSERFQREVGVLYRVPMGVAPAVLAHSGTAARPWFATEYVPGLTVEEAVGLHGPLPPAVLWLLLAEIAAKLHEVHEAGIVHRDLKHSNVMLVRGSVKLIDFGIARSADQARLTKSGASYGTPGFTAPEQRSGDANVAAPADVYSLGALILYAASGNTPSENPGIEPVRRADASLAPVVESCLAAEPRDRPTAAGLVEMAQEHVVAADPAWPPGVMARIERRREFDATPVGKITTFPPPEPGLGPGVPPRPGKPWLHVAAKKLAQDVRMQWEQEERLRQVHDPYPLPVRFDTVAPGLSDHWANIRGTDPGHGDPGPLPLAGGLNSITAVYKSIPSERLVVLGPPGSGKTILALRFVLGWLDTSSPGDRVPVIFSLGSWDPAALSLRDWMCRQLARDHNSLEEAAPDEERSGGGNLASALVDHHRILPVLDGFDEIAPGLQGAALGALNYHAGPLVLTSRPGEYAAAVRAMDVLTGAACVQLMPMGLADVDDYLTRASPPATDPVLRTVWEPVLAGLRAPPDARGDGAANVAEALATPLMVALARTAYSDTPGHDPQELLDTARFPTPEAVREHLLAQFVPAAYHQRYAVATWPAAEPRRLRPWNQERAQHWLGYLAWHMETQGKRDLAWWELGTAMRLRTRMRVVGAVVAIACAIVSGLVYGSAAALASGPGSGLWAALVDGVLNGLGLGLTFYFMHGFATRTRAGAVLFEPSYLRIRLRGGTISKLRESVLPRVGRALIGGALFGILWAIGSILYPVIFPDHPRPVILPLPAVGLALGPGLGVTIGFVAAIGTALEASSDKENAAHPRDLLRKNRVNVLARLITVGLVIGLECGYIFGPVPGLATGLVIVLGAATMNAWGRWVVLARIWLPLTGQLPPALLAFLEDAHHRGVLRQAGAVYQFRHARIQAQLAEGFARGPRQRRH